MDLFLLLTIPESLNDSVVPQGSGSGELEQRNNQPNWRVNTSIHLIFIAEKRNKLVTIKSNEVINEIIYLTVLLINDSIRTLLSPEEWKSCLENIADCLIYKVFFCCKIKCIITSDIIFWTPCIDIPIGKEKKFAASPTTNSRTDSSSKPRSTGSSPALVGSQIRIIELQGVH